MSQLETDVAIIILTLNEACNLPGALDSVAGWAKEIHVVDSFSTDDTVKIALSRGCNVTQNRFVDFSKQRNHAIEDLSIGTTWIIFLDADERLTGELKAEISEIVRSNPAENGFYLNRRLIWMGKWIRRGYYPTWILRMMRVGKGRCEDRAVNEHLIVEGKIGYLRNDFLHDDRKGVHDWIEKHNMYASREAAELMRREHFGNEEQIPSSFRGAQAERKRWLRMRVWNRLPPLARPFLYFFYRYFLRGGFLDGSRAFIFHFLQGLWFPLLIDIKYLELRARQGRSAEAPESTRPPNTRNS